MAETFTSEELEQLQKRAEEQARVHDDEPDLREGFKLLAEVAGNLIPKLSRVEG